MRTTIESKNEMSKTLCEIEAKDSGSFEENLPQLWILNIMFMNDHRWFRRYALIQYLRL